ncbi:hypothetical protein P154DRAFT_213445 [Amniculicola lignicola CBS 123094]|uniref:F-box domain-containing protein n=1 Tax=Amniculicola lignicola CBS 123094 TaxID=1392246 RepID=A0A6A5WD43_9PLEO|nr:hypothetical protein P154DRAFT_213445 [Amniculicola lignicola CBS 123094]
MSLATLPIELLDEIFDNIERDLKLPLQHPFQTFPLPTGELIFQNSDINRVFTSLALTCQRLATVVRPRIYRDVEFAQNTSKATAFFTTIKQNPTYGQFVRTLRATRMFQSAYDEYVGFKGDWYEPRAIWPQLLGHLRSLKELTVATNPVDGVIFPLINTKIDIPARQSIEKLVLEDGLHLNAIFGIFSLPRLHHLDFVYSGPYHKFSPRELSQLPGSNLKTLRVNRACLGKPLFEKLLECCPKLESFTCRHPLSAYGAQRDADDDEHRRPPLSPELMETVLKNAKYTLKQLNIVRPKHPVTAHDESRLDLSDWTALERISIPSHYFVAPFKYNSDRNGFYKLLPVSLKALSVRYHMTTPIQKHGRS